MKAWHISADGAEYEEVVLADTRGQAIYRSTIYLEGHYSFTEIRAKRYPKFDGDIPPTPKQLHDDGWRFECAGCGTPIHRDYENLGAFVYGRPNCSLCIRDRMPEVSA